MQVKQLLPTAENTSDKFHRNQLTIKSAPGGGRAALKSEFVVLRIDCL